MCALDLRSRQAVGLRLTPANDVLQSMKEFYSLEESKERADDMKQMLEPFFLRRLKRDVAMGLPDKTHVTEYCHPTSVQEHLYAAAVGSC